MGERDYMRQTPEDEERIQSFEEEIFEQEYGEAPAGKRRKNRKVAIWIVAVLVLLALVCWWLGK